MGRILVVGDVHWSTYSSIVRGRGERCSVRLEHLISSIDWCERLAEGQGCESIVYLGDFFDKPDLTSEEISMLDAISWSNKQHIFIVGNHESNVASLEYNSADALRAHGFFVVNTPKAIGGIVYLPYITEGSRKPLREYLGGLDMPIVFSHNDIKGIRYGMYESKTGFSVDEIESSTSMYINGHLHNGGWVNNPHTILNLGNICGQNFSEDAFSYQHRAMVLDTNSTACEFFENPHALNFYKFDVCTKEDIRRMENIKSNAVLSIKCNSKLKDGLKALLDKDPRVLLYKLIIYVDQGDDVQNAPKVELKGLDYMERFKEFIIENLGGDEVVMEELGEVCRQ